MKHVLFIVMVFCCSFSCQGQTRRPIVDITTSPQGWSNQKANLCAQVMTIPRIGICASADFQAFESVQSNFLVQSSQWGFHSEIRYYPFGEAGPHQPFKRKRGGAGNKKKYSCFTFASQTSGFEKGLKKVLQGFYVAPGFVYRQENLTYVPLPELGNPNTRFNYRIVNSGASLGIGYLLRIGHLTLGAGWDIRVTTPKWEGPFDIFGDNLYTMTYPWKLNIQYGPRLEAGINF